MGTIMTTISIVTMIVTAASLIAASTPTPKDDIWIGKLYKLIDLLALNIGKPKKDTSMETMKAVIKENRIRARDGKGRYIGDDPLTEEDEAWVQGKE